MNSLFSFFENYHQPIKNINTDHTNKIKRCLSIILLVFLIFFSVTLSLFSQEMVTEINALAITSYVDNFTRYSVQLTWEGIGEAEQYKIFKSTNQDDFQELDVNYEDEGIQFVFVDRDIDSANDYQYYIVGYSEDWESEPSKTVSVNTFLPSCPAEYPVNEESVEVENPTFQWTPCSITSFPYQNEIYDARLHFSLTNLSEDADKTIWEKEIDDINLSSLTYQEDEDIEITQLIEGNRYRWTVRITGFDENNSRIAESITGGVFIFQSEKEEIEEEVPDGIDPDALSLNADSISYQVIEEQMIITAKGQVQARYEDFTLNCEDLQINLDKTLFIAQGKVNFKKGEESFSSELLSYNWKNEKIIMESLEGELTGEKIEGLVYYTGEKYENFPEVVEITGGSFTTCDLEKPHYHIEAKEMTIYPEDKIVAKDISWYEGERRIFSLPYFLIFIKGENQLPYIPKIGQSSGEGWYFKNTINYYIDQHSYGSFYLDWFQKKGLAAGVRHNFELGENGDEGKLSIYLYNLKKSTSDTFNLTGQLSYQQRFQNDFSVNANVNYNGTIIPGSGNSSHKLAPQFNLVKSWENSDLKITGKYDISGQQKFDINGNVKIYHNYQLSDDLSSKLNLYYTSKNPADREADLELRPEWTLKYRGNQYTLNLITVKQIDLDGERYTGENRSKILDKLPELTFQTRSSKIAGTNITYNINASVGNYYEGSTDQENVRGEYIINLSRPFQITDHIRLNTSGVYRQDVYLSGEARYLVGGKLDLRVGYQPEFYGTLSYNYYMSEGPTPFNFDRLSPLTESLTGQITLKPREDIQLRLSSNYNLVSESFGSLNTRLSWKPTKKDYDVQLSTNFDLNNQEWSKRVDTKIDLKLNDKWRVRYSGSVLFDDLDIKNSVISVVRDLHCREITLNYKQSSQSIWVDFLIKAFPSEKITIGQ